MRSAMLLFPWREGRGEGEGRFLLMLAAQAIYRKELAPRYPAIKIRATTKTLTKQQQ